VDQTIATLNVGGLIVFAIGGGNLRDLLAGFPPPVLHREIYALAALLAFAVRVLGFTRRCSLPAYGGDG
jgi:uncharacterized membrane protein YeiH